MAASAVDATKAPIRGASAQSSAAMALAISSAVENRCPGSRSRAFATTFEIGVAIPGDADVRVASRRAMGPR
jgi:hypothetical protein